MGGHAKGAKLHKHAAASVCKLAGPNRQPSASEGCRSGAAAAGLLVGTLVSCCRGTAPTEFELQLQGSEVRLGSGHALDCAGAVPAAWRCVSAMTALWQPHVHGRAEA